ncbi:MAG: MFS transporter [Actinomycetota bacterium]|nr:MFS transporter [Actinomycetota bacterium]
MTEEVPRLQSTTFTPFSRLALAHAIAVCGDVFITVSLAGTLFFTEPTDAARPKVLLYLVITMAPFAVIAPFLGPFLDRSRGGRRALIAISSGGRALLCFLMAGAVASESVWLYPLAFGVLVLSKSHAIAKSALVPGLVDHRDELVLANARLALIGVLGGFIGAPIAAAIYKVGGADASAAGWVLRVGAVVFFVGMFAAFAIPRARRAGTPETTEERALLNAPSIVWAGAAMGIVRLVVGFLLFFAAFVLKKENEPAWMYGLVLVGSSLGNGIGTLLAPALRNRIREEWILAGALLVPAVPLMLAARSYGRAALIFAAFIVAMSAATSRLAFDSLLQRDGHEAARGRAFARFETRFQLLWVGGGVLAVVLSLWGGRVGVFLIAMALLFTGLWYLAGVRRDYVTRKSAPPAPAPE